MSVISKVSMPGPLSAVREDLVGEFTRLGYAPSTTARHLQQLAHLSRWMIDQPLGVEQLSWDDVGVFCSERGFSCIRRSAPVAVRVLMRLFWPECGPAKATSKKPALAPRLTELLADFGAYLGADRGLSDRTIEGYLHHSRRFIDWHVSRQSPDLGVVTIGDIDKFLIMVNEQLSMASARAASVALRALFSWMFLVNRLDRNLAPGIVPGRHQLHTSTVEPLPAEDVERLLAAPMSPRDRAILLLLVRLGLRAGEVAGLCLEDFNWRAGTVRVVGKGNDSQLMPVPVEIGGAVADYLWEHRPATSVHRGVFLTSNPPIRLLSPCAVSMVVTNVARRAGIEERVGSHRLRHSAATAVLAGNGTLAEAGQLLRHRGSLATAIYAKANLDQLSRLARPWPAGEQEGS